MERVGFVGLGTMGSFMAANRWSADVPVMVWNRTPGRAAALVERGATEAATPADLARASDVVIVCVSDTPDMEAVLFGEDGLAQGLAPGGLVIDCSSISSSATRTSPSASASRPWATSMRRCRVAPRARRTQP